MGCLNELLMLPLYFIYYTFLIFFHLFKIFIEMIINIFRLFFDNNHEYNKKDDKKKISGLSHEDGVIAKKERMSFDDYIEAEEYDDDNLDKDEWER